MAPEATAAVAGGLTIGTGEGAIVAAGLKDALEVRAGVRGTAVVLKLPPRPSALPKICANWGLVLGGLERLAVCALNSKLRELRELDDGRGRAGRRRAGRVDGRQWRSGQRRSAVDGVWCSARRRYLLAGEAWAIGLRADGPGS